MNLRVAIPTGAVLLAITLAGAGPAAAHHSGAMFDRSRKVTLEGAVKRFQYVQPHSWIDVETTDAAGKPQTWSFEAGAPGQMKSVGLTPSVLKVGDKISITGYPLRDGRNGAAFLELTLPDGKTINTGRVVAPAAQP